MADEAVAIRELSPEDEKRRDLLAKLHPSVLAVIERLKNKSAKPAPTKRSSFVMTRL